MKFVDQIRIHAKAGDGGNGCCSFRREKFIPRGGPNGGDGGKGGDIIIRASKDVDSLVALYYQPEIKSRHGVHGQGSDRIGRSADPVAIQVPVGTLIYRLPEKVDTETWDPEEEEAPAMPDMDPGDLLPIADLSEDGQEFILCKGGDGGLGNTHFKSSTNRVPRKTTPGFPGEEGWFLFELRTIAFAGLVGFPNAGKSTLLGRISAAHPKVAAYPFTTLHPIVGVVELPEYRRVTVADIPGLIEGAHNNKGLGHEFLRHIMRCRLLLFVVDTGASEGRNPIEDLEILRTEMSLYDPTLAAKPWCIVANKMDLPEAAENLTRLQTRFPRQQIVPVSAESGEGIEELKKLLDQMAQELGVKQTSPDSESALDQEPV